MSIRIRIDGMKLPDSGTFIPVRIEHNGNVCMGAKIVGEAVYVPSKADCLRAMTDEELAEFFANKQTDVENEIAEKGGFSDHISTKPTVSEWLDWLKGEAYDLPY